MSKAVFFDWDDTLTVKLRSEEEIGAARIKFGDSLVLINDGENRNYTTTDIIQLLKELTKSEHKWFIVSCGSGGPSHSAPGERNAAHGSQLKALEGENIKATEEVWLNLGMLCPEDEKLTATTELIRRHFDGNVPNDSLFVDDQIDNINIIKRNIPQIKTIKPGEDEEPGTTPHTDGSGQMKDIHATFYVDVADVKFPRYLLIRDKVDAIRTTLNLPVGGHPPAGAAARWRAAGVGRRAAATPVAPLASAPAPPAAPTRESDAAMALRLAGGVVGTTAFHREQEGPPAPLVAAPASATPLAGAAGPTWEWQGDAGRWTPYSAEVSTQLEEGWGRYEANPTPGERQVEFVLTDSSTGARREHYVDIKRMHQGDWAGREKKNVRRVHGGFGPLAGDPAGSAHAGAAHAAAGAAHAGAAHAGAAEKSAQEKLIEKQEKHPKGLQQCMIAGKGRWKIRVKSGATVGGDDLYYCIDDEIMKENLKDSINKNDLDGVKWWFNRVTSDSYSTGTWTSRWYNFNKDDWITDYITTISGRTGDIWSAIIVEIGEHVPNVKRNDKRRQLEQARAQHKWASEEEENARQQQQGNAIVDQLAGMKQEQAIKVRRLETELAALSGGGKKRRNKRRRKNTKRRTKKRKYTKRKSKRSKTKRQSKRQSKKRKKTKRKSTKKRKSSSR